MPETSINIKVVWNKKLIPHSNYTLKLNSENNTVTTKINNVEINGGYTDMTPNTPGFSVKTVLLLDLESGTSIILTGTIPGGSSTQWANVTIIENGDEIMSGKVYGAN